MQIECFHKVSILQQKNVLNCKPCSQRPRTKTHHWANLAGNTCTCRKPQNVWGATAEITLQGKFTAHQPLSYRYSWVYSSSYDWNQFKVLVVWHFSVLQQNKNFLKDKKVMEKSGLFIKKCSVPVKAGNLLTWVITESPYPGKFFLLKRIHWDFYL